MSNGPRGIAFDPRDPRRVYVGSIWGGGLFKSEDGGKHWQRRKFGPADSRGLQNFDRRSLVTRGGELLTHCCLKKIRLAPPGDWSGHCDDRGGRRFLSRSTLVAGSRREIQQSI